MILGPAFPLRHLSALFGRKYHWMNLEGAGSVRIRPKSSDGATFLQVFRNREYDLSRRPQYPRVLSAYQKILDDGQVPVVIDAGANVGAAAIWFATQFPRARVLALEPDAENAELCRANTRSLPNVRIIEAAIGSENGRVSLINPARQAWAVQTIREDRGGVPIVTIPGLLGAEPGSVKLFMAKIDIEGFEGDLFASNTAWVETAEVIMVEPHDWLFPGKGTSLNLQRVMAGQQFEMLISGENLIYVRLHD